jgi:stage III sporulation protein AD
MDILNIAGIAISVTVIAVLLRQYKQEYAVLIGVGAGLLLLVLIITAAKPAFSELQDMLTKTGLGGNYSVILFKSLGICFITQFASDTCKDAGESGIASKVELAGKFAVVLGALPLFEQVADLAINLIG